MREVPHSSRDQSLFAQSEEDGRNSAYMGSRIKYKQSKLMFLSVHLACPKFAATDTSYFLSQAFTQPPSALITCV